MPLTEEQQRRLETEDPMVLLNDGAFMSELEDALFLDTPVEFDQEMSDRNWKAIENKLGL